jgi:hypothetical protein
MVHSGLGMVITFGCLAKNDYMISRSASTSYGPRGRREGMDLSGTGKRLAQIYTPAGRPNEPYGARHLPTLDYH